MKAKSQRPETVAEYIEAAPAAGRPLLCELYALLKSIAPDAQETMKWNTPFFVEPRFLFAFSAHKAHLSFSPMESGLDPFREELAKHETTKNFLKVPYDQPLPVALIRKIAKHRLKTVRARTDDSFWG